MKWFHLTIHRLDIERYLPIRGDMQLDIAFFELLAQVFLIKARLQDWGRQASVALQWCDNASVVGASGKLFSSKEPLCWGLQA